MKQTKTSLPLNAPTGSEEKTKKQKKKIIIFTLAVSAGCQPSWRTLLISTNFTRFLLTHHYGAEWEIFISYSLQNAWLLLKLLKVATRFALPLHTSFSPSSNHCSIIRTSFALISFAIGLLECAPHSLALSVAHLLTCSSTAWHTSTSISFLLAFLDFILSELRIFSHFFFSLFVTFVAILVWLLSKLLTLVANNNYFYSCYTPLVLCVLAAFALLCSFCHIFYAASKSVFYMLRSLPCFPFFMRLQCCD